MRLIFEELTNPGVYVIKDADADESHPFSGQLGAMAIDTTHKAEIIAALTRQRLEPAPEPEQIGPLRFVLYCLGTVAVSLLWFLFYWPVGLSISLFGAFMLGSMFEALRAERERARKARYARIRERLLSQQRKET